MFRKRRRPTPHFQIPPPFNPISGDYANLESDGIYPYCAMMQVAADDIYDDYVVCRGFDTRIQRFVDYEENSSVSPGISVAKPFGCRFTSGANGARKYRVGEIFPAFLPTQGTADFVPPSPVDVKWRLGQNPGVAEGVDDYGGHPALLSDQVSILYDHNQKVVNWMLVHSDSERHFRFQSRADLIGTFCEACVRQMSGEDPHIADIHDPDQIFSGMQEGTKGICFFQGGKYYIVQAKCDPDTPEETCE